MRLHVDLGSHFAPVPTDRITQVDPDPPLFYSSNITGDYLIPAVDGTSISVTNFSYVLPINGNDVSSQIFGQLLARFPQYRHVYFNPLLQTSDIAALDTAATWDRMIPDPAGGPNPILYRFPTRAKVSGGVTPAPMTVSVLPLNTTGTLLPTPRPVHPGVLVTDNIDLTAATSGAGADDFMVYWKVYTIFDDQDIAGCGLGSTQGANLPAFRRAFEIDQEPSGFAVYISIDDGQNWVQARRLQQVAFCGKTNQVKLAFLNTNSSQTYTLAHFAILF